MLYKMKRLLCTILLLSPIMANASTHDESKIRYYRHEVNLSRTVMSFPKSQWDDYEKKVYQSLAFERDHDNGRFFGASSSGTSISYFYHFNQHVALGAIAAFTTYDSSLSDYYRVPITTTYSYWDYKTYHTEDTSQYISGGEIREKSFFLMPSFKWSWLNNSWCSLYMKASLGFHYQKIKADTGEIPRKNYDSFDDSKLWFAYVATPFGWEIGKQKVRAFLEFGFGSNTNLQIGLTYRFKRY